MLVIGSVGGLLPSPYVRDRKEAHEAVHVHARREPLGKRRFNVGRRLRRRANVESALDLDWQVSGA